MSEEKIVDELTQTEQLVLCASSDRQVPEPEKDRLDLICTHCIMCQPEGCTGE